MTTTSPPPAILDAALALGEQRGWDAVHVYDVAQAMGVPLADIARHYGDKDALAEAWFDRADAALLAMAESPGWMDLTPRQRLHQAICAWLDALAPHRRISGEMLLYKFQPEHLHLQAQGVMRISRTAQWIREVARIPSVGWRREFEEAALTSIYLATFARWLGDGSAGAERTRAFLDGLLSVAERAARQIDGPRGRS
jgi:ubiquinone biosynthesis protein COQ9